MVPPEQQDPPSGAEGGNSSAAASTTAAEPHKYYDDPYESFGEASDGGAASTAVAAPAPPPPPAPPAVSDEEPDEDEEGMVRMSFFEHLEELRTRLLHALGGLVLAFAFSLIFAGKLWEIISRPAVKALVALKVDPPALAQIAPLEFFNIVWLKLPLLSAIFLGSPWLLYQVWAFVAPGLYKRERRWAGPFVVCSAGLFILGGLFAYFVVFRFALEFLLGLGLDKNVRPVVSVESYFNVFVNVTLGCGIVFELPVLIFFLTLLRLVSPAFLMRNVRYAILAIFALAAVITPTPDIFNMVLFATPMVGLFFVGIFASYLLVLKRENRRFPWGKVLAYLVPVLACIAGLMYYLHIKYGYHFVPAFPWFVR
jgi:sec-independent protein translocase protein TatC